MVRLGEELRIELHICQYLVFPVKGLINIWKSAYFNQNKQLFFTNMEKC